MKRLFAGASMIAALLSTPAHAQSDAFTQAITQFEAEQGGNLASAPKIKPDGKFYFVHGKIQIPDKDDAGFIANLAPSEKDELLANALNELNELNALQLSRDMRESTDYFGVALPDSFEKYYFDNARIGSGFDLVGRYVANMTYSTVDGREMLAPVFEAVYFDLWGKRRSAMPAPPASNTSTPNTVEGKR